MISFTVAVPVRGGTARHVTATRRRAPKRLRARRTLSELGRNDTGLNIAEANRLITLSASQFITRWNFDPISEKPLEGRFEWTLVAHSRPDEKNRARAPPSPDLEGGQPTVRTHKAVVACRDAAKAVLTKRTHVDVEEATPKRRQTKITEFSRERKRLRSSSAKSTQGALEELCPPPPKRAATPPPSPPDEPPKKSE